MSTFCVSAKDSPNKFLHSLFSSTESDFYLANAYTKCKTTSLSGNPITSRWVSTLIMVDLLVLNLFNALNNIILLVVRAPLKLMIGEQEIAWDRACRGFKEAYNCIKRSVAILFAGALGLLVPNDVYPAIANAVVAPRAR